MSCLCGREQRAELHLNSLFHNIVICVEKLSTSKNYLGRISYTHGRQVKQTADRILSFKSAPIGSLQNGVALKT